MRAAIYARVSSPRVQAAEGKVSIEMQLSDCEALCRERGYTVAGHYVDNQGYKSKGRMVEPSGTRSDRPQYRAMLEAACDGEIDVIVAWKLDRLARGIYAAVPLGRVLEDTPVTIELAKGSFDASMFFIRAAIGKLEIDAFRDRVGMGVQGRLEQGRAWDTHRRYGYALEDDRLVHDPDRAPWVAQMYSWYLQQIGVREMRRRLVKDAPQTNHKSGPKKRKVQWPMSSIHRILTDAVYWQGFVEAKRGGRVFEIACPPIVDKETFDAVQVLRKQNRSHAGQNVKSDYLCLGLITCADSRSWGALTHKWRRKGVLRKTPVGRYYCRGKQAHPDVYDHPDCPKRVGSKKLDTYVWEQVAALLENPALVHLALDARIRELREAENEVEEELERVQKDLDGLTLERQWVIAAARKGRITDDDMDLQLGALTLQEKALLREQAEKSGLAAYRKQAEDLATFAEKHLSGIAVGLAKLRQGADDEETKRKHFEVKRNIVTTLVDRIVMHKEWPPEIVFSFDVGEVVSRAYNESRLTGNAQYRLTFSWPMPATAEVVSPSLCVHV